MQLGRQILSGLRAAMASPAALCAGVAILCACPARAQDPQDPTNPFTQEDSIPPPTPYQPAVGTFYFHSDLVGFTRLDPTGTYAVANRTTTVLSGEDIDYANMPGLRLLGGVRLTDYIALETSYLGLFEWNEQHAINNLQTNSVGLAGNLFSPFSNYGNPPQAGLDFNTSVSVATQSEFDTGEINVRQRLDLPSSGFQAAALWGTRYIGMSDGFSYRSRSSVPAPTGSTAAYDVVTHNRMFGAQAGGAIDMHVHRRAWFNMQAIGMLLSNESSQASHFFSGPAGTVATTSTVGEQTQRRVSCGVDLQVTLSWRVAPAMLMRVGYQGIFIDGLALGEDNFLKNARNAAVSPSELANDGNTWFHGPFAGATFTW